MGLTQNNKVKTLQKKYNLSYKNIFDLKMELWILEIRIYLTDLERLLDSLIPKTELQFPTTKNAS